MNSQLSNALEEFDKRMKEIQKQKYILIQKRDDLLEKILEYARKSLAFDFSDRFHYYCDGHVYIRFRKELRIKNGLPVLNKPWFMTLIINSNDINTIYVNFKNKNEKNMSKSPDYSLPLKIDSRTDDIYNLIDNIYEHYNKYFYFEK